MKNNIDWDKELTKAQVRLWLEAMRKVLDAAIAKIRAMVDAITEAFHDLAETAKSFVTSFYASTATGRPETKHIWREPKLGKRPFLLVAYNQVPAKRPLHNGRRGRR